MKNTVDGDCVHNGVAVARVCRDVACRGAGNAEIWYNYRQREDMQLNKSQNVEFAGLGTSPAVLTEMVWALAHQNDIIAAKGKAWSGVFS